MRTAPSFWGFVFTCIIMHFQTCMGYVFSKVTGNQPRLSYQKKISKDESENITISLKQLIENIVNLQAYIPINLYENRISTYMQISVIGSCESTNAPKDMFKSLTMYLYENYELQTGKKPTNSTLIGFFNTVTLKDSVVNDKTRKGLLTLIKEVTRLHHLSDYLGEGGTAQALGVLGELRTVLKETFQGGAFVKPGTFSVRQALREGKKVFLLFNYAESTESSIVFFDMILDQMIKQSLEENDQKVWFFLDEFSLLGHLQYLQSALAYGRSNGFRLIAAVQSVQLLEKNYSESEASCMLGLFPNVFCFFTSDYKSRQLLSNRYGKNLVSVIGYGGGKPELRERSVIQDADFYKIALPGDCIVSLAGYSPFFFRNHRR